MRHALLRKLNSKVLWLWCLSIFLSISSYAQNSTLISGQVNVEGEADPVPGISVLVKGTPRGTVTDLEGSFRINAAPGETLVISYIGYETQEITLSPGQTSLSITLGIAFGDLGEVVVMGYGSQRRADITSAVSVIDMEAIGDVPVSNASRLLQGQAAG